MEDNIQIIYNAAGNVILALGDDAIKLTRQEAENLFVDLGHALKDQDNMKGESNGSTEQQGYYVATTSTEEAS